MADQRGYNLPDSISTYDEDVYFNVDKSGFSRAKKYKASVLFSHLGNGILSAQVDLDATAVSTLGTATQLLATPGANKSYQLIDIKWAVYPTTQIDVGSQNLEIYFEGLTLYLASIRNANIESATTLIKGVQVQAEHELKANKSILCKLNSGTNPASGSATMSFWFVYKIIDV